MRPLENTIEEQINASLQVLQEIFSEDLLGVYLYGSSILGGLQKYSDIDLFVVLSRKTSYQEKAKLATHLLTISGVYKKSEKRPIEMTMVVKSEVNPWHYPPQFDFQYGDWLREKFESGNMEPWFSKLMPDLAILITQVLLASKKLLGDHADQLLDKVPYEAFIKAMLESVDELILNINNDTCNVLLTLARIWCTITTDQICSKPEAASWVINQVPEEHKVIMKRARAISTGEEDEYWDDIKLRVQSCAYFIINKINEQGAFLKTFDCSGRVISIKEG